VSKEVYNMKNAVKGAREEMGMPKAELARRAKTSRQTIHSIEEDQGRNISGELMLNIAAALRKPVEEIFFNDSVSHVEQSTA
jgi:DNA-binding XRE family transcriptional regulator